MRTEEETDFPRQLLHNLGSPRENLREWAMNQVRAMSPEQLQHLVDCNVVYCRKEQSRWHTLRVILEIGFIAAFLILPYRRKATNFYQVWISLATVLAETNDPRYVGPMLTLLALPLRYKTSLAAELTRARAVLQDTMHRLLPRVTAEEAVSWTSQQREIFLAPICLVFFVFNLPSRKEEGHPEWGFYLNARQTRLQLPPNYLLSAHSAKWRKESCTRALVALKTLEQVGDEREIQWVQRLAEIQPNTPLTRQLQQDALKCLPHLERRAVERRQAKTLLRASDAATLASAGTLLRPAALGEETPPDQLLRPPD